MVVLCSEYLTADFTYFGLVKFMEFPGSAEKIVCTPKENMYDEDDQDTMVIIDPYNDNISTETIPCDNVFSMILMLPSKIYFSFKTVYEQDNDWIMEDGLIEATITQTGIDYVTIFARTNQDDNIFDITFDITNAFLFCTSRSYFTKINLSNHAFEETPFLYNFLTKIVYNSEEEQYILNNNIGYSIEFIDNIGAHFKSLNTGSNNYFTLYSSISDRLFIYNKLSLTKNNRIYALDCNTGTIALEHEADYISGCQIDLEENIIFVSSRGSNKIDVISAEPGTNPLAEAIYLNTPSALCREIFTDNNGHLYCLAYQDYANTYLETWDTGALSFEPGIRPKQ